MILCLLCLDVFIGIAIMIGVMKHVEIKSITPLDVYQGKTPLEYKIVDGEVIDSCVIYKNKLN